MQAFRTLNFPLRTAFVASYKFLSFVIFFSSKHYLLFLESLSSTHVFISVLFNLPVFGDFFQPLICLGYLVFYI